MADCHSIERVATDIDQAVYCPSIPSVEDLWAIIEEQKELLSHYYTITHETRLWASGEKIELPQFARFKPDISDRHDRLMSRMRKAEDGMVYLKTGGAPIFFLKRFR